ncbi:MAG TPA: hypothetical protein PL106_15025, partial [Flavobacteriales bacterium]|nr:hypothetical protein [Flavobacteriales bacterium]
NSAALQFLAAHASGTTVQQSIGLGQYSWCLPRATLTLRKTSVGGTGTFGFALTNTTQTTGTITTTAAGTPQQVDGDTSASGTQAYLVNTIGTAITINENSLPSGWSLTGATCTNAAGSTVGSLSGSTYTIPAGNVTNGEAFTCTFTNTRSPTLQLAKAWGPNSSAGDSATIGATTGGSANTSPFSTPGGTNANSGAAVNIQVGNTITLPAETGTNIGNYNTVLSCTANGGATANALSGTNGQVSNTLLIGAGDAGKAIVCTYTNTRRSTTFRLAKAWGANSVAGKVASLGATTGLTNNTALFTSTAIS